MQIPIADKIQSGPILYVGVGGGFDVFGAIPLMFANRNNKPILANYSHFLKGVDVVKPSESCYPEGYLASDEKIKNLPESLYPTVYTLGREGVQCIKRGLEKIIRTEWVKTIISIDCGVDSLFHGDEENHGTILEEAITMTALSLIADIPKYHVCLGFGTENEEDLNHYRSLENISLLAKEGQYLGCTALLDSEEFQCYESACKTAWNFGRVSHIHPKIIAAVKGEFGDEYENQEKVEPLLASSSEKPAFVSCLSNIYPFLRRENPYQF